MSTCSISCLLDDFVLGRYQGDSYAGGNPWVLSTAALGSLLYRAAAHILSKEGGLPSEETRAEWKAALNSKDDLPTDPAALANLFIANVRRDRCSMLSLLLHPNEYIHIFAYVFRAMV